VEVVFAGLVLDGDGFWVLLLVVIVDDLGVWIWCEEVFGLVVVVMLFDDEVDVVVKVNDIEYGLFGLIFINDFGKGLWVVCGVEVGNLSVNLYLLVCYWMLFGGYK